jgi:S1-C subfamily serine protease
MNDMLNKLEEEVRGTQVRIRAKAAAGSGTVIYSKSAEKENVYHTYVITCFHVVEDLIKVEKEYDPTVGRDRKVEHRATAQVEFFDYENVEFGKPPIVSAVPGYIIAYDKTHDMAILRVGTIKQYPHIARLPSKDLVEQIDVGVDIWACGCGLALDPILTHGKLNHIGFEMDYKDYWGSAALITFGNSGGGAFWDRNGDYWFVGIPSRVALQGWEQVANHIGFFSPITRVYAFLEEQLLHFLIPEHKHSEAFCLKEIEDRKQSEEMRLKALLPTGEES